MKILDPVLVPDVSTWCDHINPKEFEDGGCQSVIVGLYSIIQGGKRVLDPFSRKQAQAVANSSLILQAYYWDDIINDPITQADWLTDTIKAEGLPVKWIWADQEQWWGDWGAYWSFRAGKLPLSSVPHPSAYNISLHNSNFISHLHGQFPQSGVYTNRNFVLTYAPGMDAWLPQYPAWVPHYGRQPHERTKMTWAELRANWMPDYDIILTAGQLPGQVAGHQFTGDECLLPGSYNQYDGKIPFYDGRLPLDVSAFTQEFINSLRGEVMPVPPIHPTTCPTCGQAWPNK